MSSYDVRPLSLFIKYRLSVSLFAFLFRYHRALCWWKNYAAVVFGHQWRCLPMRVCDATWVRKYCSSAIVLLNANVFSEMLFFYVYTSYFMTRSIIFAWNLPASSIFLPNSGLGLCLASIDQPSLLHFDSRLVPGLLDKVVNSIILLFLSQILYIKNWSDVFVYCICACIRKHDRMRWCFWLLSTAITHDKVYEFIYRDLIYYRFRSEFFTLSSIPGRRLSSNR